MLSVDELCSLIDREVRPLPSVRLPLAQALGHYLAEEIRADADMPAFDRAAIDGYALPENALPGWYKVVGEVTPGMPPFAAPTSGTAVKIFTGSALPGSGVGLVMVEETESEGQKVLTRVAASDRHVRAKGSHAKRGQLLLAAGTRVNPGAIALLASVGATSPLVSNTPKIMHLVTGSELVAADLDPPAGFIRDSNSPLMAALIAEAGSGTLTQRRGSESVVEAVDTLESFDGDMLLISGGASVGAYQTAPCKSCNDSASLSTAPKFGADLANPCSLRLAIDVQPSGCRAIRSLTLSASICSSDERSTSCGDAFHRESCASISMEIALRLIRGRPGGLRESAPRQDR